MGLPGRLCQQSGVSVSLSAGRNQHWHSGSSPDSAPHECLWQRPKAFGSLGLQFIDRDTAGWFKTTSQWFKCNAPEWSATTGARTNSYLSLGGVPGGGSRAWCVYVLVTMCVSVCRLLVGSGSYFLCTFMSLFWSTPCSCGDFCKNCF